MPRLRVIVNGQEIAKREITSPLVIGRGEECDVRLADSQVSRQHCRIEPGEDGWVLIDLGSSNGTVLDGRAVQRHLLKDGDRLRVGLATLQFETTRLAAESRSLDDEVLELLSQDTPSPEVPPGSFSDNDQSVEQHAPTTGAGITTETEPAEPPGNVRIPQGPATAPEAIPTPPGPSRKQRPLWDEAMFPAARPSAKRAPTSRPIRLSVRLREMLRSSLGTRQDKQTKSKGHEEHKWYRRRISAGVAITASIVAGILVYLLVWGFPSKLSFTHPPPPKALPHSSPHNRD